MPDAGTCARCGGPLEVEETSHRLVQRPGVTYEMEGMPVGYCPACDLVHRLG